jgi:hypothetical protein
LKGQKHESKGKRQRHLPFKHLLFTIEKRCEAFNFYLLTSNFKAKAKAEKNGARLDTANSEILKILIQTI